MKIPELKTGEALECQQLTTKLRQTKQNKLKVYNYIEPQLSENPQTTTAVEGAEVLLRFTLYTQVRN